MSKTGIRTGVIDVQHAVFIVLRARTTRRLLKFLDANEVTGDDDVSSMILKRLDECVVVFFTKGIDRQFGSFVY